MSDKAEDSIGEMPTLGHEEPVRPPRVLAWNPEESIGELVTRRPGEIPEEGGKESVRTPYVPAWDMEKSIGELPTLKPDGLRLPGGRRWKAGEEILGRYVVEQELGQGGMGVVYECLDKVGGVKVAVKCLPPELSHNSVEMEDIRENFQLVVGLRHSSIAGVRTLVKDRRGEYCVVMDVAGGENLRTWLKRKWKAGGVSLEEAIPILKQVAAALDYAHGKKVMHRDVKPGNVMIDGNGEVKVLDFGLAAQIRTSLSRVSLACRGTSGTGPYMAPEQWEAQPQDAKTDQYALAVMAYEMLAGHLPFENSELAVLKDAVLHGAVRDIPGLPKGAMAALRRGMAKKPEGRFGSCGAFVVALAGDKIPRGVRTLPASRARRRTWGLPAVLVSVAGLAGVLLWRSGICEPQTAAESPEVPRAAAERTRNVAKESRDGLTALAERAREQAQAHRTGDLGKTFTGKIAEMDGQLQRAEDALAKKDFDGAKAAFEATLAVSDWLATRERGGEEAVQARSEAQNAKSQAENAGTESDKGDSLMGEAAEAFEAARFVVAKRHWESAAAAYREVAGQVRQAEIQKREQEAAEAQRRNCEAKVKALLEEGNAARKERRWDDAISLANQALQLDSGNPEARDLLDTSVRWKRQFPAYSNGPPKKHQENPE